MVSFSVAGAIQGPRHLSHTRLAHNEGQCGTQTQNSKAYEVGAGGQHLSEHSLSLAGIVLKSNKDFLLMDTERTK